MARIKKKYAWYNWLALPLFIATCFVMLYSVFVRTPQAKLVADQLEREVNLITPYQPATIINSQNSYKANQALIVRTYSTPADYSQLRGYYDAELPRHGWKFVSEKGVTEWGRDRGGRTAHYCKEGWSADIEYKGRDADSKGEYALTLSWGLDECK